MAYRIPSPPAAAPRTASVAFILVVLVLDTLGIGVIIPVMPRLVASFVHGDLAGASRYYGALVALYAAMQVVAAPVLGALSDRFGRRVVILSSLLGAAINYVLMAFAPSLSWLFIGRILAGITGASFSAATAYIADVTPPEKRAQSFGLMGAAFGIGFIVGPSLGGLLGGMNLRAPFLVAAALNAANLVYGLAVLPESLPADKRRSFSLLRANPLGSIRNLGRSPILIGLTGTMVCGYLAQQILQSVWALHTEARFGWRPFDIGLSLTAVGLSSALVQGALVRVIVPRLGEKRALLAGLAFSFLSFILLGLATKGWMVYATIFGMALGGLAGPATQALLSRQVDASQQGELQGSLASLNSFTAVVGPLLSTWLFSRFSPVTAVPRIQGAAFFAAACLQAIGFVLALRLFLRMAANPVKASTAGSA